MFNVGGGELLVILLVGLIVLGPQKLPEAARQVGRIMTELKKMSNGFQQELRDALDEPLEAEARERGDRAQESQRRAAENARKAAAAVAKLDADAPEQAGQAAGEQTDEPAEAAVDRAEQEALDQIERAEVEQAGQAAGEQTETAEQPVDPERPELSSPAGRAGMYDITVDPGGGDEPAEVEE